jgi:hypothetical protein
MMTDTDKKISALFVETNGIYFNDPIIDPWDIIRNAMNYAGPLPIRLAKDGEGIGAGGQVLKLAYYWGMTLMLLLILFGVFALSVESLSIQRRAMPGSGLV